ncbi:MAG: bifunctional helix-turn-helix transcriptional regulator/GNAT family N-acetyltransferase, partial [Flavobacteriaceae bacterium]|nr:bifunctional helix-turn-helix transcriptional regulator/GNAT family N-acetyltransferase [Flavobacteriaceae bacterium]
KYLYILNQQDQFERFGELAIGSRLRRLSDLLMKETVIVYKTCTIDFDPYHLPIFKLIHQQSGITIGEISTILNVTQPAVTQYINALIKKNLVIARIGKTDKRKRKVTLSTTGKRKYIQLQPIWLAVEQEARKITQVSSNKTLLDHVRYMERTLKEKSFSQRILENLKMKNTEVIIVPFKEAYVANFRDLNFEWLEKYFYVEDHDREVLENPRTYILDNGGHIFFALYKGKVAGTVALINEPEGYELSKMAVSPEFQGLKIGQQLMQYCIDFAKEKGWKELLLYSNTILENAIYIYRKYGFVEVEMEKDKPYERGNIKMVLKL